MALEELTMRVVCSAGRTKKHLIETVESRVCFTQSWMCIVVELKSREPPRGKLALSDCLRHCLDEDVYGWG
ncbi:hypothetical protein HBI38_045830 [Parastagonospora nodorum]|nr:hypothetical protein HBI09_052940 [Parastagonospora nodorum]KAH4202556.1 hypothetical protein HBH42_019810 [Parastagonospora nodorum]KAH4268491.1 hypothetical protein HBI03_058100 [Parastagonospora nodorum]KAH4279062.1 hypothetical protein HBI04_073550 [Parastagonospora nodorum]KAH4816985.1 hypothetical protein HBH61_054730 [Parastagonospora nodorum]